MPLLGIFSKRERKSSNGISSAACHEGSGASAISEQDADSQWESVSHTTHQDDDYTIPAASSKRLRLAFRRKASDSPAVLRKDRKYTSSAQPPGMPISSHLSTSDADVEQFCPPRGFSIYTEGHFSSTSSLPTSARTAPDSSEYQSMLRDASPRKKHVVASKKSSGLLSWARERTKSKPADPLPLPAESFNLKSFRHVRPELPSPSSQPIPTQSEQPLSALDFENLSPTRSHPRGDSATSDSQRISVAAFREAQARRSATNSPVSSFKPPSPTDTLVTQALTLTKSNPNLNQAPPSTRSMAPVDSSSSSSSSSGEDESDDNRPLGKKVGSTTNQIPIRAVGGAQHKKDERNESNGNLHRPVIPTNSRSASPQITNAISRPPSGICAYGKSRPTDAKLVASRGRRASDNSSPSESFSGSDSDDAPLASLVPPRRPGSAASRSSSSHRGAPTKPLIDIRTLVTDRAGFSSPEPESTNKEKAKGREIPEDEDRDRVGLAKLAALARAEDSSRDMSPTPTISTTKTVLSPQPLIARNSYVRNFSRPSHRRMSSDLSTSSVPEETDTTSPSSESTATATRGTDPQRSISPLEALPIRKRVVVTPVVSPKPEEVDDDDIMPALRFMMPEEVAPPSVSADGNPDDKRIIPTPIRERPPPSSFSVMSRPQHRPQQSSTLTIKPATITGFTKSTTSPVSAASSTVPTDTSTSTSNNSSSSLPRTERKRASSMLSISTDCFSQSDAVTSNTSPRSQPTNSTRPDPATSKSAASSPTKYQPSPTSKSSTSPGVSGRPRSRSSVTLVSQVPDSAPAAPDSRHLLQPPPRSSSRSTLVSMIPASNPGLTDTKHKPFARVERRESPASSTGDSSSGRIPLTPRDGSELGSRSERGSGADRLSGGLRPAKDARMKKRNLSADKDAEYGRRAEGGESRDQETLAESESRRRDRRRTEAKASIELGNVINGRGPIADSDSEDGHPLNHNMASRMSQMMNMAGPTNFAFPGVPPGWNPWLQQGQPAPPMMPHPNQFTQNTEFLVAHQQAMMIAKQAYQMAVAQHAMAAAGDEWERNSNGSGFSGSQTYGGGSQLGGSAGFAGHMNMNMGMFGMGGGMGGYGGFGGMGMPNPGWPGASMLFPPGPRSAYGGFSSAQSDFGGNNGSSSSVGPGNWGSRSVYGEPLGPSAGDRSSRAFTGSPPGYQQQKNEKQTHFPTSQKSPRDREESGNSGKSPTHSQLPSRPGPRPRTRTAPSSTPVPAQHSSRNNPPSSWDRFQPGS